MEMSLFEFKEDLQNLIEIFSYKRFQLFFLPKNYVSYQQNSCMKKFFNRNFHEIYSKFINSLRLIIFQVQ